MDFSKYLISKLMKNVKIFSYITREYIKDAGTIKRLKQVEKDIIDKNRLLSLNKKIPAVFLDKDGVINEDLYNTGIKIFVKFVQKFLVL